MQHSQHPLSLASLLVLALASLGTALPADTEPLKVFPQLGTSLRIRNYGVIRIVDAKDSSTDYGCVTNEGNAASTGCGSFVGGYNANNVYELHRLPDNDTPLRCYMEKTSFRCTPTLPSTGYQLDIVNELYLKSTEYNSILFDFWKPSDTLPAIIYSAAPAVYDAAQGREKVLKFAAPWRPTGGP